MAYRFQFIRHTTANAQAFKGRDGELTVNKTKNVVVVHDGATVGGHEQAKADLANVSEATATTPGKMSAAHVNELTTATSNIANHEGRITQNENDISNLQSNVGSNNNTLTNHENRITANEGTIGNHESRITQNESDISTNAGNISTNSGNIANNSSRIATLESTVPNKADKPFDIVSGNLVKMDASGNLVNANYTIADTRNASNLNNGTVPTAQLPIASEASPGAAQVASATEMPNNNINNKIVTPKNLNNYLNRTDKLIGNAQTRTNVGIFRNIDSSNIGLPLSYTGTNILKYIGNTGALGANYNWAALDVTGMGIYYVHIKMVCYGIRFAGQGSALANMTCYAGHPSTSTGFYDYNKVAWIDSRIFNDAQALQFQYSFVVPCEPSDAMFYIALNHDAGSALSLTASLYLEAVEGYAYT